VSLKAFHIAFIIISIILAFGLCAWLIAAYVESGNAGNLLLAGLSLLAAVGLILYGVRFVRKLRNVSYL
jgi:hypothetical protein